MNNTYIYACRSIQKAFVVDNFEAMATPFAIDPTQSQLHIRNRLKT